jgi:hypothetical protein
LSRIHPIGESLLGSRNFVASENDIASGSERASRRESEEVNRKQMSESNGAEYIQTERFCYEAAQPKLHQNEKDQAVERSER